MKRPRWGVAPATILIAVLLVAASALLLASLLAGAWRSVTALRREGLTDLEVQTLRSLEQVDDHPLYIMRYQGSYRQEAAWDRSPGEARALVQHQGWACSLFAALGDPQAVRFGRNFDWSYSPALLLFADPPDAYASVSMVDIAYLGFDGPGAAAVADLSIVDRRELLRAPFLPFDGMNEHGLAVGMAAVPDGNVPPDPAKPTMGSLRVIREMLDRARTVDEAVAIMYEVNVDMAGGPAIHYLIADRSGQAALVEFYQGERVVIRSEGNWHAATNFLRAEADESGRGRCARYDRIVERMGEMGGRLDPEQAMGLLAEVSQENTQWSVVYGLSEGSVRVSMDRRYKQAHVFELASAP